MARAHFGRPLMWNPFAQTAPFAPAHAACPCCGRPAESRQVDLEIPAKHARLAVRFERFACGDPACGWIWADEAMRRRNHEAYGKGRPVGRR